MNKTDTQPLKSIPKNDEFDRVKLGARLREAREYISLSQGVVATHLGIPRSALSQIESGRRRIDALELKRIAELYRQPVTYFTGEISVVTEPKKDVAHLARSVSRLSEHDREELSRFADYLHARARTKKSTDD